MHKIDISYYNIYTDINSWRSKNQCIVPQSSDTRHEISKLSSQDHVENVSLVFGRTKIISMFLHLAELRGQGPSVHNQRQSRWKSSDQSSFSRFSVVKYDDYSLRMLSVHYYRYHVFLSFLSLSLTYLVVCLFMYVFIYLLIY